MKLDLRKEILDRKGNRITAKVKVPTVKTLEDGEVVEEQKFEAVVLTLGKTLRDSVLSIHSTAADMADKMERYNIFLKIEKDEVVDLSDEDIERLKFFVSDRYEVIFCGEIINMLTEK